MRFYGGTPPFAQTRWTVWRRKQKLDRLPVDFETLLQDVTMFADPAIAGAVADMRWDPIAVAWRMIDIGQR